MRPRPRRDAGLRVACVLLLSFAWAPAGADPGSESPRAVAQAYLQHLEASGEESAWRKLQAEQRDPWIVAEALRLLGEKEAARRLVDAGLSADADALRVYLEGVGEPPSERAASVERALQLSGEGKAQEALDVLPEPDPAALHVTEIRALVVRAQILDVLERAGEADEMLESAAASASAIGWRRAEIEARQALLERIPEGQQEQRRRRILTSLVSLDADAQDLQASALWCARLGQLEADLGSPRLARAWLLEAEGLFEALERGAGLSTELAGERARALVRLAGAHGDLGYPARCLETTMRAHEASKTFPVRQRIDARAGLAKAYARLARLAEAEEHMRAAVDLAEAELPTEAPRLRGALARLCLDQGKIAEAVRLYEQVGDLVAEALQRHEQAGDTDGVQRFKRMRYVLRLHVAAAWLDRDPAGRTARDLQRAFRDLLAVLRDLDKEGTDFTARAEIETNTKALAGRALNLLGRHSAAETHLRAVVDDPYTLGMPSIRHYALRELAHALRHEAKVGESLRHLREARRGLEAELQGVPASFALSLLAGWGPARLVEECIATALVQKAPQDIVWAFEATRGLVFREEAQRRRRAGTGGRGPGSAVTAAALRADVALAARAYWDARTGGKLREVSQAREKLWDLRLRLRGVEERADLESSRTAAKPKNAEGGMQFPRRPAIRRDEAIVYYAAVEGRQVAVLVRDERVHVVPLGEQAQMEHLLEEARSAWSRPGAGDVAAAEQAAAAALFPPPLLDHLGVAPEGEEEAEKTGQRPQHLYVSASGPLARLPWPVVVDRAFGRTPDNGVEAPTVTLVSSQAVLRQLKDWNARYSGGPLLALGDPDYTVEPTQEGAPGPRMVVFGSSLPRLAQSAEEVRALVDLERDDIALLGPDANEARLRQCLFEAPYPFDVLHLSCHGLLYQAAPWLSALAVHAAPGEDGLLTVDEVGRWRFTEGPRLVVLAACETGLGVPVPGEGEEGLVRAFQLAGARHVVASLWKVPDTGTRNLMVAFHRHVRDGKLTPVVALRAAQDELRRTAEGNDAHPSAWAGWAVWGPRD